MSTNQRGNIDGTGPNLFEGSWLKGLAIEIHPVHTVVAKPRRIWKKKLEYQSLAVVLYLLDPPGVAKDIINA